MNKSLYGNVDRTVSLAHENRTRRTEWRIVQATVQCCRNQKLQIHHRRL